MNLNNLLFIGLNGYAGSGKDTVAKMLKTILSKEWESYEECKDFYFTTFTNPTQSATFRLPDFDNNSSVLCIAYADQLKIICSTIFGIPLERFYMNKATAWVCINDKFQYTEQRPNDDYIITAEECYYEISNLQQDKNKYWLSLRDILVYVGTYVLQNSINKDIFVNIVRNKIKTECQKNPNLQYVIVTDNRFAHEIDYMNENNAISITIYREGIEQLDNIAEHELDDMNHYDFVIDNSNGYDELFQNVWDMVHDNVEFENITYNLPTHENVNNYIRLYKEEELYNIYKLYTESGINNIYHEDNKIKYINPVGGPIIVTGEYIENTNFKVKDIIFDEERDQYILIIEKPNS